MATVVFVALAAYTTSAATTVVAAAAIAAAAAAGSYIDNKYTYPALFPQDQPRPEIPELQNTAEGSPSTYLIGSRISSKGQVIWMTDIRLVDGEFEVDVAVALCLHQVFDFLKISAQGYLIYETEAGDTGTTITFTTSGTTVTAQFLYAKAGSYYLRFIADKGAPIDLSIFREGSDIAVTGWTQTQYTPVATSHQVVNSFVRDDGATVLDTLNTNPVPFTAPTPEGPGGGTKTFTQPNLPKLIPEFASGYAEYAGIPTQIKDPTISAAVGGADNQPAFEGIAYFVINGFKLTKFGNRMPEFDVVSAPKDPTTTHKISDAINTLMGTRGERPAAEYDITALISSSRDIELEGMKLVGQFSTSKAMEDIMGFYDVLTQRRKDVLHFFFREDAPVVSIASEYLGCSSSPDSLALEPCQITDPKETDILTEVTMNYIDADNDLEPGSTVAKRRLRPTGSAFVGTLPTTSTARVDASMVMTSLRAQGIAEKLLWQPSASRQSVVLMLPPRFIYFLLENDVVTFTAFGETLNVLLQRVDIGDNGLVECIGVLEQTSAQVVEGAMGEPGGGGGSDSPASSSGTTVLLLEGLEISAIADGETSDPYLYLAAASLNSNEFTGAKLYKSFDDVNFDEVAPIQIAVSGVTTQAFPNTTSGLNAVWDTETTLNVLVHPGGVLENVTRQQVYFGSNRAIVGTEIIAFTTATLVSVDVTGTTYQLSEFLRGLRRTEATMADHVVGESFVLLDSRVYAYKVALGELGVPMFFKAVPIRGSVAAAPSLSISPAGTTLKPLAPVYARKTTALNGDHTFTWKRVTRAPAPRIFSKFGIPDLDTPNTYDLEILPDGDAGSDPVRTFSDVADESQLYTEAEQIVDFGVAKKFVDIRITQKNPIYGRGDTLAVEV